MDNQCQLFTDLVSFLIRYGLWFNFADHKYGTILESLQMFRVVFIIVLWPVSVLAIYILGLKNCLDGTIYFSVIALMGVFQFIHFVICKKQLENIVVKFENRFKSCRESWQINVYLENSKLAWKFIYNYRNMSASFVFVYLFLPIIIDTLRLIIYGNDVSLFRVPLPLLGLLGPNPERGLYYYLVTLMSSLWAVNCIVTHIGSLGSIILFTSYTASEFYILRTDIKNLNLMRDNQSSRMALKHIVKDHQSLIDIALTLNKLYGFPMAVQNIAESFSLCLTLFSALYQFDSKILLLANIASGSMNAILLFGTCYIGEILQEQSRLLYDEICRIPWYEQTPSVRRDLLLMIMQSSNYMKIDYKGKSALNLQTFMQVMNSAYSYFMVLQSSIS